MRLLVEYKPSGFLYIKRTRRVKFDRRMSEVVWVEETTHTIDISLPNLVSTFSRKIKSKTFSLSKILSWLILGPTQSWATGVA